MTDCETVPPMATDPNAIDAGVIEIVAGPAGFCVCVLDDFGALVTPVHPEIDMIPDNKRSRAATRTKLLDFGSACFAGFPAPLFTSLTVGYLMR